jgi:hypothetical protein
LQDGHKLPDQPDGLAAAPAETIGVELALRAVEGHVVRGGALLPNSSAAAYDILLDEDL